MKVLLGLSGGIDSAVSAHILLERGYEVIGANMCVWSDRYRNLNPEKSADSCFSPDRKEKRAQVEALAAKIGIPVHFLDLSDEFEKIVMQNFRGEYLSGRTPSPCVICNRYVKFGAFVDKAREEGLEFDRFATGHYARIEERGGRFCLRKASDTKKDQSYFLYRLTQQQLGMTIFPLGESLKSDIRETDVKLGYHGEGQSESQDFYGGAYSDLLDVKPSKGKIVDKNGTVLGTHGGFFNYTIGQRKGLGIAAPRPLYVTGLDPVGNTVTVGYEEDTDFTECYACDAVFCSMPPFEGSIRCLAKIRSASAAVPCTATVKDGRIHAVFDTSVKAPTPGQSLVAYDEDGFVLFGGTIGKNGD